MVIFPGSVSLYIFLLICEGFRRTNSFQPIAHKSIHNHEYVFRLKISSSWNWAYSAVIDVTSVAKKGFHDILRNKPDLEIQKRDLLKNSKLVSETNASLQPLKNPLKNEVKQLQQFESILPNFNDSHSTFEVINKKIPINLNETLNVLEKNTGESKTANSSIGYKIYNASTGLFLAVYGLVVARITRTSTQESASEHVEDVKLKPRFWSWLNPFRWFQSSHQNKIHTTNSIVESYTPRGLVGSMVLFVRRSLLNWIDNSEVNWARALTVGNLKSKDTPTSALVSRSRPSRMIGSKYLPSKYNAATASSVGTSNLTNLPKTLYPISAPKKHSREGILSKVMKFKDQTPLKYLKKNSKDVGKPELYLKPSIHHHDATLVRDDEVNIFSEAFQRSRPVSQTSESDDAMMKNSHQNRNPIDKYFKRIRVDRLIHKVSGFLNDIATSWNVEDELVNIPGITQNPYSIKDTYYDSKRRQQTSRIDRPRQNPNSFDKEESNDRASKQRTKSFMSESDGSQLLGELMTLKDQFAEYLQSQNFLNNLISFQKVENESRRDLLDSVQQGFMNAFRRKDQESVDKEGMDASGKGFPGLLHPDGKELTADSLKNLLQAGKEVLTNSSLTRFKDQIVQKIVETREEQIRNHQGWVNEEHDTPADTSNGQLRLFNLRIPLPWEVYYRAEIPFFETIYLKTGNNSSNATTEAFVTLSDSLNAVSDSSSWNKEADSIEPSTKTPTKIVIESTPSVVESEPNKLNVATRLQIVSFVAIINSINITLINSLRSVVRIFSSIYFVFPFSSTVLYFGLKTLMLDPLRWTSQGLVRCLILVRNVLGVPQPVLEYAPVSKGNSVALPATGQEVITNRMNSVSPSLRQTELKRTASSPTVTQRDSHSSNLSSYNARIDTIQSAPLSDRRDPLISTITNARPTESPSDQQFSSSLLQRGTLSSSTVDAVSKLKETLALQSNSLDSPPLVNLPTKADFDFIMRRRLETAVEAAFNSKSERDANEYFSTVGMKPLYLVVAGNPYPLNHLRIRAIKGVCRLMRLKKSLADDVANRPDIISVLIDFMEAPQRFAIKSEADRNRELLAQRESTALVQRLIRSSDKAVELLKHNERLRKALYQMMIQGASPDSAPPPSISTMKLPGTVLLPNGTLKIIDGVLTSQPHRLPSTNINAVLRQPNTTVVDYGDLSTSQMARVALWGIGGVPWKPKQSGQRGLRILCLDGGGTRGVISIAYLKELMNRIGNNVRPHDLFDIICGTSTGGIIAVLLGAQRRTVLEAEKLYDDFIDTVFAEKSSFKLVTSQAYYYEKELENILHEMCGDLLLLDSNQYDCSRVFCVSTKASTNPPKVQLWRNYNYPPHLSSDFLGTFRINTQTAVRATTAAPTFFTPVAWEGSLYCDGAIVANNPTGIALKEAKKIYPNVPIELVLSIGTGVITATENENVGSSNSMGWDTIINALIASATNTEDTHRMVSEFMNENQYYRLNPSLTDNLAIDERNKTTLNRLKKMAREDFLRKEKDSTSNLNFLIKKLRGR